MITVEVPLGTHRICWEKLCNLVFLSVQSITNTRLQIISYCLLVLYGGYYESPENFQINEYD